LANRHTNLDPNHRPHGPGAILRWGITDRLLGRRKRQPPGPPAPIVPPDVDLIHSGTTDPWLTWLGHASFLGSLGGCRFLIDPLFSPHAGWLYRRSLPAPMAIDELPDVAAVMVTHNHYDHLDAGVYSRLGDKVTVVAPYGMNRWLRGRSCTRVIELGWWQQADVGDLRVTLVPACHWSRRGVFDTNRALWGGYVIEGAGYSVYHSGDTAWFEGFAEIGRRFPALEAAMLPIGGYQPAWFMEHYHLNPEQAGDAFLELGARHLVPMHWGTLQLTDEPLCEPIDRMRLWWQTNIPGNPRKLDVLDVGASLILDGSND
jgi:L-ascorbate metabolism protein UlaG (beta-lactamase superfamily)